jgi:hypothetical protein
LRNECGVQVVDVRLVMFAMMKSHNLRTDRRLECLSSKVRNRIRSKCGVNLTSYAYDS